MRTWKPLAAVLLLVSMLLAACGSAPKETQPGGKADAKPSEGTRRGITKDTVTFGGVLALTGPVAYGGKGGMDGLNLYFDWINEQGGIHGRKLKLIAEDNAYDPGKAVTAARKLVTVDQVLAIPAVFGTAPYLAVRQFLQENKVPSWAWGPASASYKDAGSYSYGIGTPYEVQAAVAMDFIAVDLKAKEQKAKVAIVFPDDAYGEGIMNGADAAAKFHGMELHKERVPRANAEMATVALNLKRSGARYIISVPTRAVTASLMKEAQALGIDAVWMSPSDATAETAILGLAGDHYADRFYGVTSWAHWDDTKDKWVAWARERLTQQGKQDVIKEKNGFFWFGFLHAMLVTEAVKRAGPDLTLEKFTDALNNLEGWDPGGLSAPISYKGQDFRLSGKTAKVSKAKKTADGYGFESVTDFRKAPVEINLK